MKTADFSYTLPDELIAQHPPEERGQSRLLCLNKRTGAIQDQNFQDLLTHLRAGDVLVMNNTRVIPARLFGNKNTGGKVEILVERLLGESEALCHIKASKSPKSGSSIDLLSSGTNLSVKGREGDLFVIQSEQSLLEILNQEGHMPLPPYIEREDDIEDQARYQTIYAETPGAVAAPTAGLHFTDTLIQQIQDMGVQIAWLTLHVGAGTFQPVRVTDVESHHMHSELYEIDQDNCDSIQAAKDKGGRVIAVGTTSVRTLESLALEDELKAAKGETDIFIYPGFEFKLVDAIITNFHLPESTLLMLVSAFAGKENIMQAYQHAIQQKYRFFSYGDAMFISDNT